MLYVGSPVPSAVTLIAAPKARSSPRGRRSLAARMGSALRLLHLNRSHEVVTGAVPLDDAGSVASRDANGLD